MRYVVSIGRGLEEGGKAAALLKRRKAASLLKTALRESF